MPFEIFISFAYKDRALRDELATHVSSLSNQGIISDQPTQDLR